MEHKLNPNADTGKCNMMVFDYAHNHVTLILDFPQGLSAEDTEDILSNKFSMDNCEWMPINNDTHFPVLKCNEDCTLSEMTDVEPYRPTAEKLMKTYLKESEVVMGEFLNSEKCGCLSIAEAHELYMKLMHEANGDRFFRCIGEDDCPNNLPDELEEYEY